MKQLFLAGIFLASVTCHSDNPSVTTHNDAFAMKSNSLANVTLAGTWELQPVLASDTATGRIPTIHFDLDKQKFTGNTGCNSVSGSFLLKGDSLIFNEQIISTKMACAGYNEKAFLDNLFKTNRYQIKEGVLQLMFNATILSNWVRHADTSTTKQI
jgi:heat shock protein HslJ